MIDKNFRVKKCNNRTHQKLDSLNLHLVKRDGEAALLQRKQVILHADDLLHQAVDNLDLRLQQLRGKLFVDPGTLEALQHLK